MSLIFALLINFVLSPWVWLLFSGQLVKPIFVSSSFDSFINTITSTFSFNYLFFSGSSIPDVGIFNLWQLPLFFIGICYLYVKSKNKFWIFIGLLLFLLIINSIFYSKLLSYASVPLFIILTVICAFGNNEVIKLLLRTKQKYIILGVFLIILVIYITFFNWHQFTVHYFYLLNNHEL